MYSKINNIYKRITCRRHERRACMYILHERVQMRHGQRRPKLVRNRRDGRVPGLAAGTGERVGRALDRDAHVERLQTQVGVHHLRRHKQQQLGRVGEVCPAAGDDLPHVLVDVQRAGLATCERYIG